MDILLVFISIVALSIVGGKAFADMPNPGTRFYSGLNNYEANKKNNR
ncbi:hypothetical protein [Clostridium manihotivorum]|nr:hypothetical protein [Clostridium manihotivorum]